MASARPPRGANAPATAAWGAQRRHNPALTTDDEEDFVRSTVAGLGAYPSYYAHMGPVNRAGPAPLDLSPPTPVDASEVLRRAQAGQWVIDVRDRRSFARRHLAGTVNAELDELLATYVGWLRPGAHRSPRSGTPSTTSRPRSGPWPAWASTARPGRRPAASAPTDGTV